MPSASVTVTVGTTEVEVAVEGMGATGLFPGTDVTWALNKGPVVRTPNNLHTYRLGVDNAGAVIATQLT